MATTVTAQRSTPGKYSKSFDVIADANGDTDVDVTHGFVGITDAAKEITVDLLPLHAAFYDSVWKVKTMDATKVTITKSGAAGGQALAQVRVQLERVHSYKG